MGRPGSWNFASIPPKIWAASPDRGASNFTSCRLPSPGAPPRCCLAKSRASSIAKGQTRVSPGHPELGLAQRGSFSKSQWRVSVSLETLQRTEQRGWAPASSPPLLPRTRQPDGPAHVCRKGGGRRLAGMQVGKVPFPQAKGLSPAQAYMEATVRWSSGKSGVEWSGHKGSLLGCCFSAAEKHTLEFSSVYGLWISNQSSLIALWLSSLESAFIH